ncbi:type II toxin-antitoxin system Phd/YefM family antitoxin [Aquibium carbonis]|uniref:type II toxin-antitoxin system Phd/YefM family antitoxin n=1 Tax=Aquibium carbonis TaxID=2495581 RepID=UPI001AECE6D8|nr:type II toxin-antitoxin system prevent-host-death family antitoxin [Aquibium carbonis]
MNEPARLASAIRVTAEEAEARIGELLRRADAGERIEVTRDGKLVAELSATETPAAPKLPRVGAFEGQFELPENWDELGPEWDEYVTQPATPSSSGLSRGSADGSR